MAIRTRGEYFDCETGVDTTGDRPLEPPGELADRLHDPAQQGHRGRAMPSPTRAGIHQDGVLKERVHLRDHDAGRCRPHRQRHRAGQAQRPARAAREAGGAGLPALGRRARAGLRALQGGRRQEEAGHGAGPGGARRAKRSASARTSSRSRASCNQSGSHIIPTSQVEVEARGELKKGRSFSNGSVESVFAAIDDAVGTCGSLADYQVRAISSGKDSLGEVRVAVEMNGRSFNGQAVSLDVMEASAKAYVRAINNAAAARGGLMGHTITEKILARAAGADRGAAPATSSRPSWTSCWATTSPRRWPSTSSRRPGSTKVFDPEKIALVPDHFTPNKDIKAAEQAKIMREFARKHEHRQLLRGRARGHRARAAARRRAWSRRATSSSAPTPTPAPTARWAPSHRRGQHRPGRRHGLRATSGCGCPRRIKFVYYGQAAARGSPARTSSCTPSARSASTARSTRPWSSPARPSRACRWTSASPCATWPSRPAARTASSRSTR